MPKYRKVIYGYTQQNGKIEICEQEAIIVKDIFTKYIQGQSFLGIAKLLNEASVQYSENAKWNKNNVGRILKNEKYIGDDIYGQIICKELFETVNNRIIKADSVKLDNICSDLKGFVYCENCHCVMNNRSNHWVCLKCRCKSILDNDRFMAELYNRIRMISQDTSVIDIPEFERFSTTLEIKRLENEMNRELDKADANEEHIKNLVISLADTRYQVCDDDSKGRNAKIIIERLENLESEVDIDLVKEIADKIIIDSNGDFFVCLKNGQKI